MQYFQLTRYLSHHQAQQKVLLYLESYFTMERFENTLVKGSRLVQGRPTVYSIPPAVEWALFCRLYETATGNELTTGERVNLRYLFDRYLLCCITDQPNSEASDLSDFLVDVETEEDLQEQADLQKQTELLFTPHPPVLPNTESLDEDAYKREAGCWRVPFLLAFLQEEDAFRAHSEKEEIYQIQRMNLFYCDTDHTTREAFGNLATYGQLQTDHSLFRAVQNLYVEPIVRQWTKENCPILTTFAITTCFADIKKRCRVQLHIKDLLFQPCKTDPGR